MQFKEKATGEVIHVHNTQDVKAYESSQGWEVVKETVKASKAEVTEKPKATKEKKESILSKLFN